MKAIILIILFLSNVIFVCNEASKCGGEVIDHCIKCNSGESSDSCLTCENKYFLFFNDLLCLPCDDSIYGQIGCKGNCDGTDYLETRNIFCDEGQCKEGFYYLNGICTNCSKESTGCSKCTYEIKENSTKGNFICEECESNEYKLNEFGMCEHCQLMENCVNCHYNDNYTKSICVKCSNNYYINSNGECEKCKYEYYHDGYCYICSENGINYESCSCWSGYTKIGDNNCFRCHDRCQECNYIQETNDTECISCYSGNSFDNYHNCTYCGFECESCTFDKENNPICKSCYSSSFFDKDKNQCLFCSNGCLNCSIDESSNYKNETLCYECSYSYALNEETNQCEYCGSIPELGDYGCEKCKYNNKTKQYECLRCNNYEDHYFYAYINNTFQCFYNTDPNKLYLYGCLIANHIGEDKYECLECKTDFIKIVNDKTCKTPNDINLSPYCLEVENLGVPENPFYSCRLCNNSFTKVVTNSIELKNITDCYPRTNSLQYCLEGIIKEDGNYICTKCVENATLNSSSICECNSDSFGKYNQFCYKCDDINIGNPGCLASKGCKYFHSNNELDCNECKEGYFQYTNGQCFSCSNEIGNCDKCRFDNGVKCDNCISIYLLNKEKDKCELDECKEYPEISPGCIICKDKFNEYKINNKCQFCKTGYFKTKEESCIYCRSEKYGGPACYGCGYEKDKDGEETNNIICKDCFNYYNYPVDNNYGFYYGEEYYFFYSILSSNAKCYNCRYDLSDACLKCEFNEDKLTCILCAPGYYINSEGKCSSFISQIELIPNCDTHYFTIGNYPFYFNPSDNNEIYSYFDIRTLFNNYTEYNMALSKIKFPIKTTCRYCQYGYIIDDQESCEKIEFEKCTINDIIKNKNINKRMNDCRNLCYGNYYFPFIYLKLVNNSIDYNIENYKNLTDLNNVRMIDELIYYIDELDIKTKNEISNISLCINLNNKDLKDKFQGCQKVIFIPNKSYKCFECEYGYIIDPENGICHELIDFYEQLDCNIENKGTELSPIYSCKSCYSNFQTLISYENGIKMCVEDYLIDYCIEANANTNYVHTLYNCTNCRLNYIPYYSKFFQRKICHNVFEKIIKYKNISMDKFDGEDSKKADEKGQCEKKYFTPDGKYCFQCDNKNVGMPGCKGECSFSLFRNNVLLCESECKEEYIESSKGICELCTTVNEGCYKCHYENNYPDNFYGIKRARRFQCDNCLDGYIKSIEGKCLKCSDIINKCDECEKNEFTGNYQCTKCSKFYAMNEFGRCQRCGITKAIINDKCINCDDISKGGVKNCYFCQENEKGNGVLCKQCNEGFVLFGHNNTCVERSINKDLAQFEWCLELNYEHGKIICTRCKPQFSLLKTGIESKCTYTPTLFDSNFQNYYFNHYYYDIFNKSSESFKNFFEYDYFYRPNIFLPCKESINLGTPENPIYSCTKCYDIFENEEYDDYYYDDYKDFYDYYIGFYYDYFDYNENYYYNFGRYGHITVNILDKNLNNRYFMEPNKDLENCTEAIYMISENKEIYNCTKCRKDNELIYKEKQNIYYCSYIKNSEFKCLVNFCKNCMSNKNYFCSNCISSDYEVNQASGSCVKKTDIVPSITWKDIYRLDINGEKEINGRTIRGPFLILRGITSSEINTKHAFLIYLTFKIKYNLRNLQETINIPAICESENFFEETNNSTNIVDYECIGNETVGDNYELNDIAGNYIKNKLVIKDPEKNISIYSFDNLPIGFEMTNNDLDKKTFSNKTFNFSFIGKLYNTQNKISNSYNNPIEMNEIKETAICDFYNDNNLNANLTCRLNMNNDTETTNLTFKENEISTGDKLLFINSLNKIQFYYQKLIQNETELIPKYIDKTSSSDNTTLIIVLSVVIGVIVLGGLSAVLIYIFKVKKVSNMKNLSGKNQDISNINENYVSNTNINI